MGQILLCPPQCCNIGLLFLGRGRAEIWCSWPILGKCRWRLCSDSLLHRGVLRSILRRVVLNDQESVLVWSGGGGVGYGTRRWMLLWYRRRAEGWRALLLGEGMYLMVGVENWSSLIAKVARGHFEAKDREKWRELGAYDLQSVARSSARTVAINGASWHLLRRSGLFDLQIVS